MKPLSTGLCTVVALLLISSLRPIQAQTTAGAAGPLSYAGEEVTITGTVSRVLTKAAPGMIVSYIVFTGSV